MARIDFLAEETPGASALVVAFSSYGFDGAPCPAGKFEWRSVLDDRNCHKMFLIDAYQHWYNGSILGFSKDIAETVLHLREQIARSGADRVITIGSSMGGFGALLFGSLLGAEVAIAYAPQTCLDLDWLSSIKDERWVPKMKEVASIGYETTDIPALFRDNGSPSSTLIYYDGSEFLDDSHSGLLASAPGVMISDEGYGGHVIAYEMVKRGLVSQKLIELGL